MSRTLSPHSRSSLAVVRPGLRAELRTLELTASTAIGAGLLWAHAHVDEVRAVEDLPPESVVALAFRLSRFTRLTTLALRVRGGGDEQGLRRAGEALIAALHRASAGARLRTLVVDGLPRACLKPLALALRPTAAFRFCLRYGALLALPAESAGGLELRQRRHLPEYVRLVRAERALALHRGRERLHTTETLCVLAAAGLVGYLCALLRTCCLSPREVDALVGGVDPFFGRAANALLCAVSADAPPTCVGALLSAGADPDLLIPEAGFTPLTLACELGRLGALRAMLTSGAAKGVRDVYGYTPLMRASMAHRAACVAALLEGAASRRGVDEVHAELGTSALMLVCDRGDEVAPPLGEDSHVGRAAEAPTRDRVRCVRLLHAAGADPNLADPYGETPLLLAAGNGDPQLVEALLHAGARPNVASHSGATPLLAAVTHEGGDRVRRLECAKLLLRAGARAEDADQMGTTPLMRAVECRAVECVKLLRAYGAWPDRTRRCDGHSARTLALGGDGALQTALA